MHTLAEKIAGAAGTTHEISLDVKNISRLSSADVLAIRQALEDRLKDRHLRLTTTSSMEMHVQVTLSETEDGRIAVAAIHHGKEERIEILPIPNDPAVTGIRQRESLTLSASLVLEQPGKILDFALFNYALTGDTTHLESRLLLVEPERLAFYRFVDSKWELVRTIRIPHLKHAVRDMRAMVDTDKNEILLSDAECSGYLTAPEVVHCSSTGWTHSWVSVFPDLPDHEGSESVALSEKCEGGLILLASGTGDWTQPDSLQGFEYMHGGMPAIPAGNAINFDGPIMSLRPNGTGVVARVVVHNLKTGNYEANLVTATCSH